MFDYEYTIKDHLGNARVSFKANAGASLTAIQENHYYPFGREIEGLGTLAQVGVENARQYNNKEFIEDFGLNLSDYWARSFDASIGRWWTVDPLATHFGDKSGYNYVSNNPVAFIDPNGLWEERADGQAYTTNNLKEIKQYLKAVQNYSQNGFSVVRGEGGKDGAVFQLSGIANDGKYTSTKFNNEPGGKKAENPISIGNGGVKNEDSVIDRKAMEDWAAHEKAKFGPWCPEVMGVGVTISGNIGKAAGSVSAGVAADNNSLGVYGGFTAGVQVSSGLPIGFGVSIDWFGGDTFGKPTGSALDQLGGTDIVKSASLGPISLNSSSTGEYRQDEDGGSRLIPSRSGLQTLGLSIGIGTNLLDVGVNTSVSKSGVWSIKR